MKKYIIEISVKEAVIEIRWKQDQVFNVRRANLIWDT